MGAAKGITKVAFGRALFFLACLSCCSQLPAQTFLYNQASLPSGNQPTGIVLADFNADGRLDIAVSNQMDNTVSILLTKPDGTYSAKVDYPVGTAPMGMISADFNGDHFPDLAVVNSQDNNVSVLLGAANGTFQTSTTYPTGKLPVAIVAADLNGDQEFDLAVANQGDGTVSVLLGKGNGTFQAQATTTVSAPLSIGTGDFNRDGTPDLVAVDGLGNVSVLLNNGHAAFTLVTVPLGALGATTAGLAVADFNNDGNSDVAVTQPDSNAVAILLGDGKGGFTTQYASVGVPAATVSTGDFNGDNNMDLVVTNAGIPESVFVLLGNGDGSFQGPLYNGFPEPSAPAAIGDMNNDGRLDFVLADTIDNVVTIELGNGNGLFTDRTDFTPPASGGLSASTVADLNGDGKLDSVLIQFNQDNQGITGFITVLPGNGDGTFQTALTSQVTNIGIGDLVLEDFTGDGKLDIATSFIPATGGISVVPGNGDGTFGTAIANPVNIPGLTVQHMIGSDFNNDGKGDLAMVTTSLLDILISNGDGTFQTEFVANLDGPLPFLASGDFNHDGNLDLAVTSGMGLNSSVLIFLGNGDGTFASPSSMSTGTEAVYLIKTADFNGDGKTDVVVGTDQGYTFFAGKGDGTFQSPVTTKMPNSVGYFYAGDFNGDGKPDLAALTSGPTLWITFGNGDGTFQEPLPYTVPYSLKTIAVGDFNADGSSDLLSVSTNVVATPTQIASVWLSTPTVSLPASPLSFAPQAVGTSSSPQSIALTNIGNAPFALSAVTTSTGFTGKNGCAVPLATGSACSIDVAFAPTVSGTNTGTLLLTDNSFPGTQSVLLTGSGINPLPAASVSPATLSFVSQPTGSTSTAQTVTLTNSGQAALNITSISASGDFSATNTCGSTLAAAAKCSIMVTFTPSTSGNRTGNLTLTDNAGGSPQEVTLSGVGSSITLAASAASLTIASAGSSATDTIQVSSLQGFAGTVGLACTVTYKGSGTATDQPVCSITPGQGQVSSGAPFNANLSVTTTLASEKSRLDLPIGAAFAAGFLLLWVPKRRWTFARSLFVMGIALVLTVAGCGGSGSPGGPTTPSDPGTTSGSYQVLVTATSGTVTTLTTIPLTLQ